MRKSLHTGLLAVAGLFACGLVVVASPAGLAVASGQVCVAVVIDEGNGATPAPQGAQVQLGANDLDVLNAVSDSFTQNDSGLVCAIDGYPPNGLQNCLGTANGLYFYWSYWQGDPSTNRWTYAEIGPAEHTVAEGQTYVEGWRYQDPGPDSPSAAPPSVSPSVAYARTCSEGSSAPASGGGGGATAGGSAGGGTPGSGGSGTHPGLPANPTTSGAGPAAGGTAPPPGVAGTSPGATTTTTRSTTGTIQRHAGGATSTSAPSRPGGMRPKSKTTPTRLALSRAAAHRTSGGNPALPIVVVAVLIGLLGTGAWLRWRRRPGEA